MLKRKLAQYRYCAVCDYVFVSEPDWLESAYIDAIVATDTDIVVRNALTALRLAALLYFVLGDRGERRYVDVAGGYGLLTRLMRDLGFDFFWSDPYAENLFARGFEYLSQDGPCSAASAIEVLEHTVNPLAFLTNTIATYGVDTIFFTTQLFGDDRPPAPDEWDYYSFETGQHISFFSPRGIKALGDRLGLNYYSLGRIHMFSSRDISPIRLKFAANRIMALPLALLAASQLGSKRGADKYKMSKLLKDAQRE